MTDAEPIRARDAAGDHVTLLSSAPEEVTSWPPLLSVVPLTTPPEKTICCPTPQGAKRAAGCGDLEDAATADRRGAFHSPIDLQDAAGRNDAADQRATDHFQRTPLEMVPPVGCRPEDEFDAAVDDRGAGDATDRDARDAAVADDRGAGDKRPTPASRR